MRDDFQKSKVQIHNFVSYCYWIVQYLIISFEPCLTFLYTSGIKGQKGENGLQGPNGSPGVPGINGVHGVPGTIGT